MPPRLAKSASLVITLAGGLIHSFLTLQLLGSWQSLRALDAESELDAWKLDGLRVLWGLLAMYLLAAAFVSFVGFFGVVRNKPTHLRLYRDCSSADLAFTAFLTLLALLAARAPARAFCEQPELAALFSSLLAPQSSSAYDASSWSWSALFGNPANAGAPDEACERALEHAALVALASLLALTVVRLHFLLAVSAHYSALVKAQQYAASDAEGGVLGLGMGGDSEGERRAIRLLPLPRGVRAEDVVYAPVHCPSAGESVLGTRAEVWVRSMPTPYADARGEVKATQAPASGYAPAYVAVDAQAQEREEEVLDGLADAGLLDAGVVGMKREWI
ncbi:hypothetical protein B0H16DRAFT_361832 [Mycena metata]|uniref:Uncharacterized protein n=1 Tax=Mycena metata TaxID=1033252 RepID=A0AAD7HJA3_9AGAR|nr:hypothetical protein B0H16DRAFT_361832 [Mycena metata]